MFKFKLNKSIDKIITDSGINSNAALFAARTARDLMRGYVPMDSGALAGTAQVSAEKNRGTVRYTQPYAVFCYYGGKKIFKRDKHEKATAYWDKAMLLSHRGELTKSVRDFIKSK